MVSAIIRIFVVVIIFVSFAYQSEAQQITAVDVKYEVTESNLEISFRLNGNSSAKPCSHGSLEIYAEVTTLDGKKIFRDPRKSCLVMMHTLNSTSQHKLTIPWKHWFYTGGNFTGILTLNAWCDDDKVLYSTALRDTVNFQVPKHQIDKYCNTYRYFFYDQELTMTEFTTENTSIGLKLTGKIVAKFPKDSILFMDEGYDYYIVPVISKGEKVLYNGNLNYSSSASLTFYDQKPRWFSLVIPYKELDLINDLQYDITFYYRAKETYKPKKPIGSFSYFPALPAPVSISDLNVTATNFRVNPDTMVDGVQGMLFTAKAHFSHPSSIVRPSEECKSIGVKFSVQLSGKAGETKFVLPQTSEHNRTSYYTYTPVNSFLTYHPDTAKDIELFVPFCKILQPPVRLDMKAELTAELSDGCKVLPVLASKDFYFTHPGIRRYKFEVQSLGVVVKEYDVAGKNIPIIGAFIGGRKGRGRGAPELAWVVDHGNDVEYRSQVARNSYTGFGGKTNFFTCPNDRITLSILDIDYFLNPTDNIEYIKLPKAIPYMMNLSVDTAIGDVSDLKYKISAYMPEFPASNSLNVMTYKATYKGVSGIVVAADKGITLTDCVGIPFEPILFNNSIPYNPSESYYVNTEVDKSLMFSGTPSVFPNNFFVPYYSIRSGSSCGITVKCGETPIFTRLSSENIVVPPIRDAKPSVVHF
ncbi:MAG: hypothetical protein KKA07_01595, partial [Bacteroidetes bacterium]|nr:hypothetical protein [Bacteroidota bacterium]MBU1717743.1 hypothetical protein [Bacteroidota bacterium]